MIKVIYKTMAKEAEGCLKKEIGEILLSRGQEISWIGCGSRQELEYAISKDKDVIVLLQEGDYQEERCEAWEIAAIRDIEKVRVVPCVRRVHYGTSFMAVLYAGGIVDALFEDEADAEHIAGRLTARRNRRDCREYYGIRSINEVISVLQIVEQDTLERYIRFIDGGINKEEMLVRFQEVAKKLCYMEKCCLVESLPENVLVEIAEDAELQKIYFPQSENIRERARPGSKVIRGGIRT